MPRLIPPELGNGTVPVLDVSEDTHALVGEAHAAALDPDDDTTLLTGTVVIVDNQRPAGAPDSPDKTVFIIGGSTMQEAATEVVGALGEHALEMPRWVASTNAEFADVIAEHYTIKGYSACKVIPMEEAS